MEEFFNKEERALFPGKCLYLARCLGHALHDGDFRTVRKAYADSDPALLPGRDRFGFNSLIAAVDTAISLCRSIDPDRNMVLAILLSPLFRSGALTDDKVEKSWGADVARMVRGLAKVGSLYSKAAAVESDNFRKLLLTFAQDIRVIIIMIVDRLTLMRAINHHPAEKLVRETANEANYLYAQLAHRLGLYAIKSELEDMSLKYSNRDMYSRIAHELNETKVRRDAYIADFIAPLKAKLEAEGLKFEIKAARKVFIPYGTSLRSSIIR